jgi:hypothetical protein
MMAQRVPWILNNDNNSSSSSTDQPDFFSVGESECNHL